MEICKTCGKPANTPYRRYSADRTRIVEGCIDGCHTLHMVPCTNSTAWHNRPTAKAWRVAEKKRLKALLK